MKETHDEIIARLEREMDEERWVELQKLYGDDEGGEIHKVDLEGDPHKIEMDRKREEGLRFLKSLTSKSAEPEISEELLDRAQEARDSITKYMDDVQANRKNGDQIVSITQGHYSALREGIKFVMAVNSALISNLNQRLKALEGGGKKRVPRRVK